MSTKKSDTRLFLEKLTGGPVALGKLIEAIRLGDDLTQVALAKKLKVSRSHLNDIEKGNKAVSPERAARFARALKQSEERFVELALQSMLDQAGLKLKVNINVA
jgi:transcriptional regulator with XRE-family HTH domain